MNPRKRMLIQKGRIGGDVEVFAKLPDEVLRSEAHTTLPFVARVVLEALAAQYRGSNNGSLTLTRATAKEYGIANPFTLDESLRELEARGLIFKTRLGTRPDGDVPPRSAMFALTWCRIDPPKAADPHDETPTVKAHDTWRSWQASNLGLHWTVKRRDRTKDIERAKEREEEREEERRKLADNRSPMHPMGTSAVTQWVQGRSQTVTQWVQKDGPRPSPNGCLSEILGVGEQGKSEVAGGKPAGRPEVGEPISPQAEIQRAPPAALKRPEGWRARYQEILMRVLETVDSAPRRARRLGKPHLEDPYWAFAVALLCEGTGMDAKEVGNFLGRLVKSFGWSRVKKVVQECEALMLWGFGAIRFVEDYPFLLPAADQDDVLGVPATSSASAGAGNPDRRLPC